MIIPSGNITFPHLTHKQSEIDSGNRHIRQCSKKNAGRIPYSRKKEMAHMPTYRVALNFCGSLILRMGDFMRFAGTNFCDWEKLVYLAGN